MSEIYLAFWDNFRSIMDPHIRMVALVTLVLCIGGLTATILVRRRQAPRRVRRIMMWMYFFFIVCTYGIADNIDDQVRVNFASYLTALCFAGLLLSLLWHTRGDNKLPNDDGSIGSRFILWLDAKIRRIKARRRVGVNA